MFDVGFWELCLIGLVSLLVIGPKKLPAAARIAGFWLGKTRNMVASVKAEIKEELQAEEMRQILKEHSGIEDVESLIEEGKDNVEKMKSSIKSIAEEDKQNDESK